jgi:hypothetical protein
MPDEHDKEDSEFKIGFATKKSIRIRKHGAKSKKTQVVRLWSNFGRAAEVRRNRALTVPRVLRRQFTDYLSSKPNVRRDDIDGLVEEFIRSKFSLTVAASPVVRSYARAFKRMATAQASAKVNPLLQIGGKRRK